MGGGGGVGAGGGRVWNGGSKTLLVNPEIYHCIISESYSPMLIVGTEDDIFTFELQNNSRRRRFKAKNVASLECDYGKRHIYWSNRREINELYLHTGVSEIFPFR